MIHHACFDTTRYRPFHDQKSRTHLQSGIKKSLIRVGRWGLRNVLINGFHQFRAKMAFFANLSHRDPSTAAKAEPLIIGISSPGNSYAGEKLAHFHLNEFEQALHHRPDRLCSGTRPSAGTPTWRARQDVFASLRHWAVSSVHHQNRAVHLRRTRDHVLHVVRVTRAVDVRVVTIHPSRIPREQSKL